MNDRREIPTNHEARRSYSSTNEVTNKTTSHDFFKEGSRKIIGLSSKSLIFLFIVVFHVGSASAAKYIICTERGRKARIESFDAAKPKSVCISLYAPRVHFIHYPYNSNLSKSAPDNWLLIEAKIDSLKYKQKCSSSSHMRQLSCMPYSDTRSLSTWATINPMRSQVSYSGTFSTVQRTAAASTTTTTTAAERAAFNAPSRLEHMGVCGCTGLERCRGNILTRRSFPLSRSLRAYTCCEMAHTGESRPPRLLHSTHCCMCIKRREIAIGSQ
ncbi:unnamed protein product [Trichogramma brassicae]|uniref:Uncharacterized protein n=1 Tax=Trichogramma brassicae TaxID=86971 RepID=A0A6H5J3L2_9HYME|nr:unnamed protein product [Trichogramma brassicae]